MRFPSLIFTGAPVMTLAPAALNSAAALAATLTVVPFSDKPAWVSTSTAPLPPSS